MLSDAKDLEAELDKLIEANVKDDESRLSDDEQDEDEAGEDDEEEYSEQRDPSRPISVSAQQALFGPSFAGKVRRKPRKPRTGKTSGKLLPADIQKPLNEAQAAYVGGNFKEAIDLLSTVAKMAPRLADPYFMMGTIYEEFGDPIRAIQLYAFAATLMNNPVWIWKQIAELSYRHGEYSQGLAATNRCIRNEVQDAEVYELHMSLLLAEKDYSKAASTLSTILIKFPGSLDCLLEFCKISFADEQHGYALASLLLYFVRYFPLKCLDASFSLDITGFLALIPEYDKLLLLTQATDAAGNFANLSFAVSRLVYCLLDEIRESTATKNRERIDLASRVLRVFFEFIEGLQTNRAGSNSSSSSSSDRGTPADIVIPLDISIMHCIVQVLTSNASISLMPVIHALLSKIDKSDMLVRPIATALDRLNTNSVGGDEQGNQPSSSTSDEMILEGDVGIDTNGYLTDEELISESFMMLRLRIFLSCACYQTGAKTAAFKLLQSVKSLLSTLPTTERPTNESNEYRQLAKRLSMAWTYLGKAFNIQEKTDEALSAFLAGIQVDTENAVILRYFGEASLVSDKDVLLSSASSLLNAHFLKLLSNLERNPEVNSSATVEEIVGGEVAEVDIGIATSPKRSPKPLPAINIDWSDELRNLMIWVSIAAKLHDSFVALCIASPLIVVWVLEHHTTSALRAEWLEYIDQFVARPVALPSRRSHVLRCLDDMKTSWEWLDPTINFVVKLTRHASEQCSFCDIIPLGMTMQMLDIAFSILRETGTIEKMEQLRFFCEPTTKKLVNDGTTSLEFEAVFKDSTVTDDTVERRKSRPASSVYFPAYLKKRKLGDVESIFVAACADVSEDVGLAALEFVNNPCDISCANKLTSLMQTFGCSRMGIVEVILPVQRLTSSHPESVSLMLWAGHDLFTRKKFLESLERYLDAYKIDPNQPLTSLCLATLLQYYAKFLPAIKKKHLVLLKSFTFLNRYRNLRLNSISCPMSFDDFDDAQDLENNVDKFQCGLVQEVVYNTAKFYQEVHLNHLAEKLYRQVLRLEKIREALPSPYHTHRNISIVIEAAHNLVLIYKNSGALDLAYEVMVEFLQY